MICIGSSFVLAVICPCGATNQLLIFSACLGHTWNESSQRLIVLISVPVGLPPVGVVLADDMQDVSLLEGEAELPTRHEGVVRGVVVKVSPYMHLRAGEPRQGRCTHTDRPTHTRTHPHAQRLTTVCLCGAGLI